MESLYKRLFVASIGIVFSAIASAMPIINGSFDSAVGWNTVTGSGSVDISGGVATLSTGNSAFPADPTLVQGDDGFFTFSNPLMYGANLSTLTFDARFESLGADATEDDFTTFFDNLSVSLYDSLDFVLDLIFVQDIDFSLSSTWSQITLDVSSLADRMFALSFELNDEADGQNSRLYLDNVAFNDKAVSVPEPGMLPLLSLGLLMFALQAIQKKRWR